MDSSCLWSVQQTRFCCLNWRVEVEAEELSEGSLTILQPVRYYPLRNIYNFHSASMSVLPDDRAKFSADLPLWSWFSANLTNFWNNKDDKLETKQEYGTVQCKLMAMAKERGCCWSGLCKEWSIYTERLQLNQEPAGSNLPASFPTLCAHSFSKTTRTGREEDKYIIYVCKLDPDSSSSPRASSFNAALT